MSFSTPITGSAFWKHKRCTSSFFPSDLHSFVHLSFTQQYLLSTYNVPISVLSAGGTTVNGTDPVPALRAQS